MAKKILVVDDDKCLRKVIKEILQEKGYRVVVTDNGQEALKVIERGKWIPNLIITDYNMPIVNGVTLIAIIKDNSQIPAILLTGASTIPENKADMVLNKPVRINHLLKSVAVCLNH